MGNLLYWLIVVLVVISIWAWQPGIFAWQAQLQAVLTAAVILLGGWQWHKIRSQQRNRIAAVSEQGDWLYLDDDSDQLLQISRSSRVSGPLIWLNLHPRTDGPVRGESRQWLFRDQVGDDNFRRLCRIVIQRQKQAQ